MKKYLLSLTLVLFATQLTIGQDIIPYPNSYEEKWGSVTIPKRITVSYTAESKDLIPVFIESS